MLFILCGALGLRIGEALGIEIDKHIASDFALLRIRQKARHCKIEAATEDGRVRISGCRPSSGNCRTFEGIRRRTQVWLPVLNSERQTHSVVQCHPAPSAPGAKKLKYVNQYTGNHKAGNHAFRRFRNTYLRNHTECPEGLLQVLDGARRGEHERPLRQDQRGRCSSGRSGPSSVVSALDCLLLYRMYRKRQQKRKRPRPPK